MTPQDMTAWRARLGISREAAAEMLGLSYATIGAMEKGERRVRRTTELACRWLEHDAATTPPSAPAATACAHSTRLDALEAALERVLADIQSLRDAQKA